MQVKSFFSQRQRAEEEKVSSFKDIDDYLQLFDFFYEAKRPGSQEDSENELDGSEGNSARGDS